MRTIDPTRSALLVIDFQARLMPAIHDAEAVLGNARRLVAIAGLLGIPLAYTEQNPAGLGPTHPMLEPGIHGPVIPKMSFDACRDGGLVRLPPQPVLVVTGCEAHVCVLQTMLGLLEAGRQVFAVQDAIGARRPESRDAALARAARHGAEIVTTEMVAFEWLQSASHPRFRDVLNLIK